MEAFIWLVLMRIHTWGLCTTSVWCVPLHRHTQRGCRRSVSVYLAYDQCGSGLCCREEQNELQAVNRIIKSLDALQMLLLCLVQIRLLPGAILWFLKGHEGCVLCAAVSCVLVSSSAVSLPPPLCLSAFLLTSSDAENHRQLAFTHKKYFHL